MSSVATGRANKANALRAVPGDLQAVSPLPPFRRVITLPGPGEPTLLRAATGRIAVSEDGVPWAVSRRRPLTVIDLRRGAEIWHRCEGGSPEDLQVLRMPLHDPAFAALPWAEHNRKAFRRYYRKLARKVRPQTDAALKALAAGRDVLITCQLGRDRTGIVMASLLAHLDASPAAVRDDGDLVYRELAQAPWWLSRVLAERGETLDSFLRRNEAARAAFHDLFDTDPPPALHRARLPRPGSTVLSQVGGPILARAGQAASPRIGDPELTRTGGPGVTRTGGAGVTRTGGASSIPAGGAGLPRIGGAGSPPGGGLAAALSPAQRLLLSLLR